MREAAADERFEEAARYRNRLFSIRHLAERQAADQRAVGTVDVIGLAIDGDEAAVQVFPLRDGKMIDRYGFHLENVVDGDVPVGARGVRRRVLRLGAERPAAGPGAAGESATSRALEVFLSDAARLPRRGARAGCAARSGGSWSSPPRTPASRSSPDTARREEQRLRRVAALEELRECLNLESLPVRIECFDVSNIQGESIVASMVVFVDGRPKNAHYRTFAIRGVRVGRTTSARCAR